ncbi:hypothetical protein TNCT_195211 [Trichonephila clavata]|uniref:Uncharacterized protein n=1 Tax=Trichonephila clavata TaxID=2740835 RepID=A0A8X6FKK4_TRICU|nr:hypothetical protein TNCT_195211 [Trichonephila clavata]
MELVFPTVHVSLLNNTMPPTVHGQQDTSLSRKCIHHTTKQWFKTVHEYFKDFDEQHRLPYDKAVLETLVGIRIALGNDTERKYCFYPPPLPHRGFRFPAVQHTHVSLDYKAMLQTCQWTS